MNRQLISRTCALAVSLLVGGFQPSVTAADKTQKTLASAEESSLPERLIEISQPSVFAPGAGVPAAFTSQPGPEGNHFLDRDTTLFAKCDCFWNWCVFTPNGGCSQYVCNSDAC